MYDCGVPMGWFPLVIVRREKLKFLGFSIVIVNGRIEFSSEWHCRTVLHSP